MLAGTIVTLAVFALLLAGTAAFDYFGLREPGRPMSPQVFGALILGSLFSFGAGVGLMGLLFTVIGRVTTNRHGCAAAAIRQAPDELSVSSALRRSALSQARLGASSQHRSGA
jgi:hypothetical protein